MKNRKQLLEQLNANLSVVSINKNRCKHIVKKLFDNHNIPINETSVFLSGLQPLNKASDEMLYFIAEAMQDIYKDRNDQVVLPYKINWKTIIVKLKWCLFLNYVMKPKRRIFILLCSKMSLK